jgi:hypothetical protein
MVDPISCDTCDDGQNIETVSSAVSISETGNRNAEGFIFQNNLSISFAYSFRLSLACCRQIKAFPVLRFVQRAFTST